MKWKNDNENKDQNEISHTIKHEEIDDVVLKNNADEEEIKEPNSG